MRAAGVELTAQKRMGSLPFDDLVPRPREAAARDHRHAFALVRVPADGSFQLSGVVRDTAPDDGEVGPAQRAVLELRGKSSVAHIVPGDHDQPRRALVEAVHHARPRRAADRGPGASAAEQGMDEGSGVVPRRRVDDHAGGLVDDRDVVVLVNDVQRDLLRAGLEDIRLRDLEVDDVSGSHAVRRVGGVTVDQDEMTLDEPRGRGAAQLWGLLGEKAIEPRRRGRGGQPAGFRRRR